MISRRDVTIRGAGIFGLSIAHVCARRGARVRVLDVDGIGAGASGGIVGALAPHTPENWNAKKAFQFDSLCMSQSWWGDVAERSGLDPGYGRTGRLQPVADVRALALADARADSAVTLWQGLATWQVIPAAQAGAWAPHSPTGWLIHDTLSARLHPSQACAALAAALRAQGAEIVVGSDLPAADTGPEVWATGHTGLTDLSADLGRPVGNGVKGQAALLRLDRRTAPQLFGDSLHIVPHADGTVAVGSTSEREFDNVAGTDAQLDAVLARAVAVCPALADAPVLARWAGVRPRARSRAPMLGQHPERSGIFIANGGFKIGFGMAPKIAETMADLVLDGVDAIPDGFRVTDSL